MKSICKRVFSLLLAVVLVIGLMPVQALAAEIDGHSHDGPLDRIQHQIDDLLTTYLGATDVHLEEIQAIVDEMDWETYQTARWEISELEASKDVSKLNEEELQTLLDNNSVLLALSDALEAKAASDDTVSMLTTVSVLDGQLSITDSANSNTVSNGVVTITAKGSLLSAKTNNITITNETANMEIGRAHV